MQSLWTIGGGCRVLRNSISILGGGSVGGRVPSGYSFIGTIRQDHGTGSPVAFNKKCLLALCGS